MKGPLLFVTFAATLVMTTYALADNSGLYVGVSVGGSRAKDVVTPAQVDSRNAADGLTTTTTIDPTDRVWKLYGGYKFFKYFSIEGGYTDFGKVTVNSLVTASVSGTGTRVQKAHSKAAGLAAVAILPLPLHFELFGKAGVDHWESAYSSLTTLTSPAPAPIPPAPPSPPVITTSSSAQKEYGTSSFYGAGLGFALTDNLAIRGEWERFNKVGNNPLITKSDMDVWSVGVKFSF